MSVRCTVLLPVHNGMPYLPEALDSILQQTERELKVIVLDDGSMDGTKEYLRTVADSRLTIITSDRIGLPAVLNHGLTMVTTEYVARMDADDIAVPERIGKQLAFLETHPEYILAGSWIEYMDETGMRKSWAIKMPLDDRDIRSTMAQRGSAIFHATVMLRTEAFRAAGGYDSSTYPAEDYDLFFRIQRRGKLFNLPEVLLHVRINDESVIGQNFKKSLDQYRRSLQKNGLGHHGLLADIYYMVDGYSAVYYRKGMSAYLNGSLFSAVPSFILSACINPLRALRFILKRIW